MSQLIPGQSKSSRGWDYQEYKIDIGGISMERVREVNINEAVIHILNNNSEEPVLNEYKLSLSEEVYMFLLKHIEKCLRDEDLKYALFKEEGNIVKEISEGYLNGQMNIIDASKEIASQLFIQMKNNVTIPSGDLIVASISTEYGMMLAILKMDYIKSYTRTVNFIENKVGINIVPELGGLPTTSRKIEKCAFIKRMSEKDKFNLYVIDRQKKKNEEDYEAEYFINKFLKCNIVNSSRDITKNFLSATEKWARANLRENAEAAEKIRSTVRKKLKENDKLDLHQVANELFSGNAVAISSYIDFMNKLEVDEEIEIDKNWIEEKYKKIKLNIDRDIDLTINESAYTDINKFQVQSNGDGSINIVIKNVLNYFEK